MTSTFSDRENEKMAQHRYEFLAEIVAHVPWKYHARADLAQVYPGVDQVPFFRTNKIRLTCYVDSLSYPPSWKPIAPYENKTKHILYVDFSPPFCHERNRFRYQHYRY